RGSLSVARRTPAMRRTVARPRTAIRLLRLPCPAAIWPAISQAGIGPGGETSRRRSTGWGSGLFPRRGAKPERTGHGAARVHFASASRSWRPLRPPDAPVESADEPVHLRLAERHPHHR